MLSHATGMKGKSRVGREQVPASQRRRNVPPRDHHLMQVVDKSVPVVVEEESMSIPGLSPFGARGILVMNIPSPRLSE